MSNAKHVRIGAKTIAVILAVILAVGSVVGGTVAWLITETDPVVNTFTYGDINIKLEETGMEKPEGSDHYENEFEMIPGSEITKDPKVTVKAGSEACWLFVKLEKKGGVDPYTFDDFLTYEMGEGWTELEAGVYYRAVDAIAADGADAVFEVLKDNKVTVKDGVTKEMLNALDENGTENYPTLTITAYAVQMDNIATAAEAWALVEQGNVPETTEAPAGTEAPTETSGPANP